MLNYWWVTRPKRKLNSIPEVLSTYAEISLDQEWRWQRDSHLSFEDALEAAGLKRHGERRDHTGGGGRTYQVWVESSDIQKLCHNFTSGICYLFAYISS